LLKLLLPARQGTESDTKVFAALLLSEVRMLLDLLQGIELKLLIVLFALA
jgi:hypothetical protein